MKENKYDDNIFFQKYSQMSRSQQGLAGAGEWETLRKLLPDFKDKRVLDLGCGYGWHCIYAMEHGASSVVGVDISHKMLEVAKEKTHFPQVEYKCCAIEDVEFPEESFDVILSSLAFHYVADYEILVKKIYRILKSGGKLVFTVEHPVFTAYGTQDWHYNERLCHNKQLINSHFYRGVSELPYKLLFAVIYTHLEFRYEVSHTITSHHVHHFHQTRIPDGTLLDYMVQYRKPLFPQFFLYPKKFLPENNPHHKEFHLRPYIQNNANQ